MTAPPRSPQLVVATIIAVVVVGYAGIVAGGRTWDDTPYHADVAPPRLAAAAAIQRGAWPAWWDGSGLGVPLSAEPTHAALYPPTWLGATPRALDLVLLAHLVWAGLGVAVWARRRASDLGAAIAGALVATTGVLASCALRGSLPAIAHVGWLGAAVGWLVAAETRRTRALAASAIGVLLGAIALAGPFAVVLDAIVLAIALGARRTTVRWLAAAVAIGLAIGCLQWLPALLALGDTAGARTDGLTVARLGELVVPGREAAGWPSIFIGGGLVALATIRAAAWRELVVIGALAIAAFALPGGPAWLGPPALHLAVLAIVLGERAAAGADALLAGAHRPRIALLAAIAVCGLAAGMHADAWIGAACSAASLGLAVAVAWRPRGGLAVAVAAAALVGSNLGAVPLVAPQIERELVSTAPPWAELAAATHTGAPVRAFRPVYLYEHPALADAIATFAGASADRWGVTDARSDDPARPEAHDRVWLAAAAEGGALLDRFGIALAVLPTGLTAARRFSVLGRRGTWSLVGLPVAPAAAAMASWRRAVDPADALALMFARFGGAGMTRGTIVLRGSGDSRDTGSDPKPCTIVDWSAGDIALTCALDRDGYAVVSSTTAPGWSVTVDDAGTEWLTADVLRRAVPIAAGSHAIHWRYATPGRLAAALVALLGVLGLGVLGLTARRA